MTITTILESSSFGGIAWYIVFSEGEPEQDMND